MKRTNLIAFILIAAALVPQTASAQDKAYFGVAMLNSIYRDAASHDHYSNGLVGRLGYDIARYLAVETHFGGSIGTESNVNNANGKGQLTDFYSAFLCLNSHFGNKRIYALGGMSYGTREFSGSASAAATRDSKTGTSYGAGIEAYHNDDISFNLEWVRYFDNSDFAMNAYNLGLLVRF